MSELSNVIQPYAWGSRHALAQLRGEPAPSPTPEAELWMGAHPLAPSRLCTTGQSLNEAVASAPSELLGREVAATYGAQLPFLLKVLAAATPLSLQAHPSIEQAEAGFAADEAAGLALDAPHRNYRDRNHKPELLCALSEFWALCGFREVSATLALLDELSLPELAQVSRALVEDGSSMGLSRVFSALMMAPAGEREALAQATTAACAAKAGSSARFAEELRWGARIGALYPGDVGVVVALLLNLLRLAPGEAIYLPAGNLHAYLEGTGVEIMASSDNVLRGGLTPKHVNVQELLRVLDFSTLNVQPLRAVEVGREHIYRTPAREFQLSYFQVTDAPVAVTVGGPEIWLVATGHVALEGAGARLELRPGKSAFVSASVTDLRLSGSGRIFRARVAQPG
ncbi:MAG: mannose-6-phosphate isomerase, class I [Myxococcales bacterium]|nr:MAG: mannose-6-phosphate isomerase, class I [Myxococcales bacterium]